MVDKSVAHLFTPEPQYFPLDRWPKNVEVSYSEYMAGGIRVYWRQTYRDAVGHEFFREIVPKLQSYGSEDDVRIIVWFD